ncbi:hypothetical protein OH76DRAFT_1318557, partial [Lentinus brumalis]
LGCSPYFAVTGTSPIMPFDIAEATYLMPIPTTMLSTAELVARRAIALQKRPEQLEKLRSSVFRQQVEAAKKFERENRFTIRNYDFKPGRLVLMRNTAIEKSLNRKMRPRYLGPYAVVSRNKGGAYIIAELNGAVFDRPVAAFRLIPYLARDKSISLPRDALDIGDERLRTLEESDGPAEGDEDYALID